MCNMYSKISKENCIMFTRNDKPCINNFRNKTAIPKNVLINALFYLKPTAIFLAAIFTRAKQQNLEHFFTGILE